MGRSINMFFGIRIKTIIIVYKIEWTALTGYIGRDSVDQSVFQTILVTDITF